MNVETLIQAQKSAQSRRGCTFLSKAWRKKSATPALG